MWIVIINDISVIYVTENTDEEEVGPTVGLPTP